jgi:hypothetical protein
MLLTLMSLALCYAMMFSFGKREPAGAVERPASWLDLSGSRLAALVTFVPGAVSTAMATYKRDWSTVFVGLVFMAGGFYLWTWGKRQPTETRAPDAAGKA